MSKHIEDGSDAGARSASRVQLDRRRALVTSAGILALGVASHPSLAAKPAAPSPQAAGPAKPRLQDRIVAKARDARMPVAFDGQKFSGPGWDFLVKEGAAARFFFLGEEHGTVQIPILARELVRALKPSGYERLALEISAPVAAELDAAAANGVDGVRKFNAEFPPGPAFYNFKAEAEFLGAVRPAFPRSPQMIWGLDYEVIQDRRLIARLQAKAPSSARSAVQALDDASAALWKKFAETHNPQFIFSFSGDPKLITDIRAAWPHPDRDSDIILDVLQATLETNAYWVQGKGYESNLRRTQLMRGMLARYWQAEKTAGRAPKTFFKFGASHAQRGRDTSATYDIGELAAGIATLEGGTSFHLFAGPPRSAQNGAFNPSTMTVMPVPASYFDDTGVGFLADLAFPDGYTLIDLRALRPVLSDGFEGLDSRAINVIHGFDAILVMPGTTATTML
jgi:hypothetical protein